MLGDVFEQREAAAGDGRYDRDLIFVDEAEIGQLDDHARAADENVSTGLLFKFDDLIFNEFPFQFCVSPIDVFERS